MPIIYRKVNSRKRLYGLGFVLVLVFIIAFVHFGFMYLLLDKAISSETSPFYSNLFFYIKIFYYIIFTLMLISFIMSIIIDPGIVPPNWGFHVGEESKRRRYCKMCHVWKPDRTHHCSICNRCVLNMDHHCPWINNCVGFYNRKFFFQLLIYVYLLLIIILLSMFIILGRWISLAEGKTELMFGLSFIEPAGLYLSFMSLFVIILFVTMTSFLKFHKGLIQNNLTTIENLEFEGISTKPPSKYDIGHRRNWEQVFGPRKYLWWLPFHSDSSRPVGDGVRWRIHFSRILDEDEDMTNLGQRLNVK